MLSSSFTSEGPQEDEEMKCPKCLYFFSSLTKPYILPCNHNMCLNCINLLIQENNPKCPICSSQFNKNDTNSFEVNFTFLNIIIKILETKLIYCTNCNKIFYWKEHYKICEQKYFENCDNILEEIKINCEESAKIVNLMKENGDIMNKYKIEVYNVTRDITKEIHKTFINNIRPNIKNELFNTKILIDFEKAKTDLINFVKLFSEHPEHFDIKDINKIIENNKMIINYTNRNINSNSLSNSYSDIKIKTKALMNKRNFAFSPPTKYSISSEKKSALINNMNKSLINNELKKKINYKINKLLNNNNNSNNNNVNRNMRNDLDMKEVISEEKEQEEETTPLNDSNNLEDEGIGETGKIKIKTYHENNISEVEKLNKGKEELNDNNNSINKITIQKEKNLITKNPFIALSQQTHQRNRTKFDIKFLLNENININEEENTKNKIIVGLKDVKVISLKQSTNNLNNQKLYSKLMKPNKRYVGNKMNLSNIAKNKPSKINNSNNRTKNEAIVKTIKLDPASLSLLRSTEFTKRDYHFNSNLKNKNIIRSKNKNNHNIIPNYNMSFASTASGFNEQNFTKISNMSNLNNSEIKKENLSSRNNNKTLNSFYLIPQKNSSFVNPKIFKNYNKIKELTDKLNLYSDSISFLSNTINNSVDENIFLLNNIIANNYELLLNEISSKQTRTQKRFCLSFYPNTYKIILYDPFKNKFTIKNYFNIMHNKDNIIIKPFNTSNSIIFDDSDSIFITGGESSYDIFLILSLSKENMAYRNKIPTKKAFHKSIFIKNNLYIIGGEDNNKKISKECFFFNMEEKKWHYFPNLNKGRKNFSLCLYNDSILYTFMGEDDKNILDTIEFIDINNLNDNKGWIFFKPIDLGFVWHSNKNALVINIDKDKILICGGENNENILYKDCFLFKPSTKEIYKGLDLKIPSAFISEGCFYKEEIFGIDYKNKMMNNLGFLHCYNIKKNIWNCGYIKDIK